MPCRAPPPPPLPSPFISCSPRALPGFDAAPGQQQFDYRQIGAHRGPQQVAGAVRLIEPRGQTARSRRVGQAGRPRPTRQVRGMAQAQCGVLVATQRCAVSSAPQPRRGRAWPGRRPLRGAAPGHRPAAIRAARPGWPRAASSASRAAAALWPCASQPGHAPRRAAAGGTRAAGSGCGSSPAAAPDARSPATGSGPVPAPRASSAARCRRRG